MCYLTPMSTRRASREVALQVLFQYHFSPEIDLGQCLSLYESQFLRDKDAWKYAENLIHGVLEFKKSIDELISSKSLNWKIERIAGVDLNILRLAVFEMKFMKEPIPRKVAINEAVDIAKKFGSENSSAFVNGVLDQI